MDVTSLRQMLFFTTVHIRAGSASGMWTGTGFFFADPTHVNIVTNKHVLAEADWIEFTALRRTADGTGPDLGRGMTARLDGPGIRTWVGHPDEAVDVAVFPSAELFGLWKSMSGQQPFYKAVTPELFSDLSSFDAIEDVIFVGYPDGLFDTANLTPIARHGRTATPPCLDYQGEPTFLIDAPVFGGSSGSPVFAVRDALTSALSGDVVLGSPAVSFVGIVAAVEIRPVVLEVTHQSALIGMTELEQELGLGIVFKPLTVLETFAEAERRGRYERQVPVETSQPT